MSKIQIYTKTEDKGKQVLKVHPIIKEVLDEYFAIDFYGTKVAAPYFINTKRRKDLRALVGKGSVDEIVLETKVWAQVHGLDLSKATAGEIRQMMLRVGIGIDCSGLVVHALSRYTKEVLGYNFFSKLKYSENSLRKKIARWLRPVENINAYDLTGFINCESVALNQVKPGDLIRGKGKQRNAYHVAIVTEVVRHKNSSDKWEVEKIVYVQSHREYGDQNGVRIGEIIVENPKADILQQNWTEVHTDGHNYIYEEVAEDPTDAGLRRLKFL